MTVQKSFKRLVRARMAKTGESYTAARTQLLAGADDTAPQAIGKAEPDAVPSLVCSDERIRERTGRGWEEWFDLLDSSNAESLGHTDLARRVASVLDIHVLAWNVQAVVTSFERARGLRAVGERVGGGFVATASKTIAAQADDAFMAFVDPARRASWLPEVELTERTASKPRSARFDVGDGTSRLLVTIDAKGPEKTTVAVEHSRLRSLEEREDRKASWRAALVTLKAELERDGNPTSGGRR
jgi:hypothetical protein